MTKPAKRKGPKPAGDSREALEEALNRVNKSVALHPHDSDGAEAVRDRSILAAEVRRLQARPAPVAGWVSFKDKWPPVDTEIVCLTTEGHIVTHLTDKDEDQTEYQWCTHWLDNLPPPPQQGDERDA